MLRKTLTILSLIGLLLSVGLWARSFRWMDVILIPTSGQDHFVADSVLGVIHVGLTYDSSRPPVEEARYIASDAREYDRSMQENIRKMMTIFPNSTWNPYKAFQWENSTVTARGITMRTKAVAFPHWLFVLLFSMPLFVAGARVHRRRKRKKLGLCLKCGYDLRGSKKRCPECGTAFQKA
ncbi:MAG: hypothetical protein IIA33_06615 [Planctomycetes bacterium]|nr:hypothetical protein [Planctomycetota bacterium]